MDHVTDLPQKFSKCHEHSIIRDIDWARLAAFVDGEGTICIQKNGYNPIINVANDSQDLFDWLVLTFGGRIWRAGTRLKGGHWVPEPKCKRCVALGIQPYLLIKGKQCKVFLELLTTFNDGKQVPDKVMLYRLGLVEVLCGLNA